jgi:hypothetical protein
MRSFWPSFLLLRSEGGRAEPGFVNIPQFLPIQITPLDREISQPRSAPIRRGRRVGAGGDDARKWGRRGASCQGGSGPGSWRKDSVAEARLDHCPSRSPNPAKLCPFLAVLPSLRLLAPARPTARFDPSGRTGAKVSSGARKQTYPQAKLTRKRVAPFLFL